MSKIARKHRKPEFRTLPSDVKGLEEKRTELIEEMGDIVNKAEAETRTLSEDENKRFGEIRTEIANIDTTLKAIEEARALENKTPANDKKKEQRTIDEENFLKFVRGEERALSVANNGGIIPVSIANRIIETVKELSPIYRMVEVYNVSGDLVFPVYDETQSSIKAVYVDDLTELTEGTGKFKTVKLTNHVVGCLAKISKSLMNRTDFDLVSYVVRKVAQSIAEFLEKELIKGTDGKMNGIEATTNVITSENVGKIVADDLIEVQMAVPEVYQKDAAWIMNKKAFKSLRKLKTTDGEYLLTKDLTNGFGWMLLNKPVYITESADEVATGNKPLFYGDYKGLALKLAQNVEIQILMEKFATQHAIGVVGYIEADSKMVDHQKIAALKIK